MRSHSCRFLWFIWHTTDAAGYKTNDYADRDSIKHRPVQGIIESVTSSNPPSHPCAILLFDDPVHAAMSLLRRGFAEKQFSKLRNNIPQPNTRIDVPELLSIKSYAEKGADSLGFIHYLAQWVNAACGPEGLPFPIIFARSSALKANLPQLASLLNLDTALISQNQLESGHQKTDMDDVHLDGIEAIYGELKRIFDGFDFELVQPGAQCSAQLMKIFQELNALDEITPLLTDVPVITVERPSRDMLALGLLFVSALLFAMWRM